MTLARIACSTALRGASLFAALASLGSAQDQLWIRQFGSSSWDRASGIAGDGSGGVYVSGVTFGSLGAPNAGGDDAWLERFDEHGNFVWIRQFGSSGADFARGAAPDGAGGVYSTGATSGNLGGPSAGQHDAWLVRYDGAGNQTWLRQLGTSGNDWAEAAAPDGAGGVFVSGYTNGSLGGPSAGQNDAWLARYDSAGSQSWLRQLGTSGEDWAEAVTPDGAGGVYVCGVTYGDLGGVNAGQNDAWLARYDGAGNLTWVRQLGSSAADLARGAAPDGAGGVFVCGVTYGSLGGTNAGSDDAWLARYDSAGNLAWVRQIGSAAADVAYEATADGTGGVYVCGQTNGSLGGANAGDADAWLARYDGAGQRRWIRQLGTSSTDVAAAVASDGAGGVFVSGETGGSLGGPSFGLADPWLARYDGGLATARYCSPAVPNSTGRPGILSATGSNAALSNDLTLIVSQLPHSSFGYFLTSRTGGYVTGAGGGQGALCLGGAIGRFVGPGQIRSSGTTGSFSLAIDLTRLPQPAGAVAAQPGQTWNFQAWHRDANPASTSNLTDAVGVMFF